jgi:hypothetical protein
MKAEGRALNEPMRALTLIVLVAACGERKPAAATAAAAATATDAAAAAGPIDIGGLAENPGCFVVRAPDGTVRTSDATVCARPMRPASTFKIPNALLGAELGLLDAPDAIMTYDAKANPKEAFWFEGWDRDQPLREAMRISAVPLFRWRRAALEDRHREGGGRAVDGVAGGLGRSLRRAARVRLLARGSGRSPNDRAAVAASEARGRRRSRRVGAERRRGLRRRGLASHGLLQGRARPPAALHALSRRDAATRR